MGIHIEDQNPLHVAENLHLISVAIDRYGLPFVHFDLASCKMDSESIIKKIKKDSTGDSFTFTGERSFYSHGDEEATLDNIHKSFVAVLKDARPDDILVVFLAGISDNSHGFRLLTHPGDQEWNDVDEAFQYSLSLEKLQSLIAQIECKRQLIILDLCSEQGMHEDLISELSGENPTITKLTDRNRVIVCTEGLAFENQEGGVLTQILTGIEGNLFHLFDPKLRKKIEFEMLEKQQSPDLISGGNTWFYSKIFYEKDYINIASAIAEKQEKTRSSSNRDIGGTPKVFKKKNEGPKDYALVVGINEFDAKPDWANLENPIEDGTKVAKILEEEYGYETQFLKDATFDDLEQAIFKYSELQDKQNLVLFFAGHGYFDNQLHDDGFIVLKDSKSLDQDRGLRSYYQFVNLQKVVDNFDFKHILLIMDVCFGGTFGYNARTSYSYTPEQRKELDELTKTEESKKTYEAVKRKYFLDRQLLFKSRYFITSGMAEVREGEKLHSPFARRLLEALESRGNKSVQNDDLLTFDELKQYCAKNINMPIDGNFGSHKGGDFILIPTEVKKKLHES